MLASPGLSRPQITSWPPILSSPWPRKEPCKGNPFQNVAGLFIPALPNLAGTTASTKEGTPATDLPLPPSPPPQRPQRQPSSLLSPSYENHFDLGDVTGFPPPIEGEMGSEQQQPEESQSSSEPSTPTQSINTPSASPARSDFREESKEEGIEGEGEGEGKEVKVRKGERRKRKRGGRSRKGRGRPHPCELPIAPRFMGLSGMHYGLWAQYVCPQAPAPAPAPPPPPSAMINHHPSHAWPFSGYHQHQVGFVAAPNSPAAPLFWNPAVPAPGFVGVSVAS